MRRPFVVLSLSVIGVLLLSGLSALAEEEDPIKVLVKELDELPSVELDREQIQKVLTNLILNAQDAAGESGHIRVSTSRENGWVLVAVRDDGCGMSEEFMTNSLFKPFQTTKKQGLGIGLFHCKKIVEAHGGRIEVESERGEGSTFRVLRAGDSDLL